MPSKKTPAKILNKSDFIRAQPAGSSAADVIAKGKAQGIQIGSSLVYMVRRRSPANAKTSAGRRAAPAATKPAAPKASKPIPLSKSEFIRGIPLSVSAKDVVAQGEAAGIRFDTDYVYKARKTAKAGTVKKAVTLPSANSVSKSSGKPQESKAAFVRARAHLSPGEIVEDAKAEGVRFDARYVYRVRAMDREATTRKTAASKVTTETLTSTNGAHPAVTFRAASSPAEDLLLAVAAELGLGRAAELLSEERARIKGLLGG
jgi:hypothetical protein